MPRAPADLSPHAFRSLLAARPVLSVLAVLLCGALIAAAIGSGSWRDRLLLAGWGLIAAFSVGLAGQSPRGSADGLPRGHARASGNHLSPAGRPCRPTCGVLSWASAALDLPPLGVSGVCLANTVFFTVRSGRPATRLSRAARRGGCPFREQVTALQELIHWGAMRLHTVRGIPCVSALSVWRPPKQSPAPLCSRGRGLSRTDAPDGAEKPMPLMERRSR